jgi:hypothetical protein
MRPGILAGALLLLSAQACFANVCVYKPPKVRELRGYVLDASNVTIPGVAVELLRGKDILKTRATGDDGVFDLGKLPDGNYRLHAAARGFIDGWYEVIVRHHTDHWKKAIQIKLAVGMDRCDGTISVVESK